MKIEPAYCTFEQSKLLKEKGFDGDGCISCSMFRKAINNLKLQ